LEADVRDVRQHFIAFLGLGLLLTSAASAQTPPQPARTTPWEVSLMAGGVAGHAAPPEPAGYSQDWTRAGLAGVVVGRYWSTHLKTELGLSAGSEGRQYIQRRVIVPDNPAPFFQGGEQFTRVHQIAGTVVWQFLENEWAHPFLEAGVALDFERQRRVLLPTTVYTGDPRLPNARVVVVEARNEGPESTTHARGIIGAGAKVYVHPRAFFRADARATFDARLEHLVFRAGFGVDF
jgi:hypothetical protein